MTAHEQAFVAHQVAMLRDELWAQYPAGTQTSVYTYCTDLRNFGMIAGAEFDQSVAERFRVPPRHARMMVSAWLAATREAK